MPRKLDHWIDSYLEYTDDTESPEIYRTWVGVSCIASALERKVWRGWGPSMTWYPNFFVVLVGPSGKARKGTAMDPGKSLLREMEKVNIASESTTKEALIEQMEISHRISLSKDGKNIPHASLTIFSKEFTVFLGYNNLELMSELTDLYDCEDEWTHRTKTQGENVIEGVWLNLLGATTPDSINSALPNDAIGGGFTSRIIFVYAEDKQKVVVAPWETEDDKQLRKKLVHDLSEIHSMMGEFTFTDRFIDEYTEWRYYIEENPALDHHMFSGYNARRVHHTVTLTMVMSAAVSNELVLDTPHFERARKLLQRTETKMPRVFQGMGESDKSQVTERICSFIAAKEETTEQELLRRFYQDVEGVKDLRKILYALRSQGFAEQRERDGETIISFNEDFENADMWKNGQVG